MKYNEDAIEKAFARLAEEDQDCPCPGCNAMITFDRSPDGTSVDMLHPQPPCDQFVQFVDQLHDAAGKRRVIQ